MSIKAPSPGQAGQPLPPGHRWNLVKLKPDESYEAIRNKFVMHTAEMRMSWAWAALPPIGRMALDRLEIEWMRSGWRKKGKIICTYDDFVAWGLRRGSIKFGILTCCELGFAEIVRAGRGAPEGKYLPSIYRLTYPKGIPGSPPPTNEWRRIETKMAAEVALAEAKRLAGRVGRVPKIT